MTKQIIAIGGGGFGRNPGKGIIEDYILKQSEAKKPNICFIPYTPLHFIYSISHYNMRAVIGQHRRN